MRHEKWTQKVGHKSGHSCVHSGTSTDPEVAGFGFSDLTRPPLLPFSFNEDPVLQ